MKTLAETVVLELKMVGHCTVVTVVSDEPGYKLLKQTVNEMGRRGFKVMDRKRMFHIGDLLSITGEKLVSPRLMEGVSDLMEFVTQEQLATLGLAAMRDKVRTHLLKQYPGLLRVNEDAVTAKNLQDWLAEQSARFGEYLEVQAII